MTVTGRTKVVDEKLLPESFVQHKIFWSGQGSNPGLHAKAGD
jgi:hypothetical protein